MAMMSLAKRRTLSLWIGLSALLPAQVTAVALVVWEDAHWHWPFQKRWWPPSPLDDTWVWATALGLTLALAFLSRHIGPEYWEGHRDQLSAPIEDDSHIVHIDGMRDSAESRTNV